MSDIKFDIIFMEFKLTANQRCRRGPYDTRDQECQLAHPDRSHHLPTSRSSRHRITSTRSSRSRSARQSSPRCSAASANGSLLPRARPILSPCRYPIPPRPVCARRACAWRIVRPRARPSTPYGLAPASGRIPLARAYSEIPNPCPPKTYRWSSAGKRRATGMRGWVLPDKTRFYTARASQ